MATKPLCVAAGGLLAAAMAACGGSSSSSSSGGGGTGGGCGAGSAQVSGLGTAQQSVQATDNLTFSPQSVTVKTGQVLQWMNAGSIAHTVTFDSSGNSCLSDASLQAGATWEVTFNTAGTYSYHCTIHPQMTGTITVSP